MRPLTTLDSVTILDGRRLSLHRRGRDFYLHLDGEELMSSRATGSESALAELACGELPAARRATILIGGLGLGFTLQAALAALPRDARVVVAEVFPSIVEWHRLYLTDLGRPLEDPRVRVRQQDVFELLGEAHRGRYHAILLDVDDGPAAWCLESNRRLYGRDGLQRIKRSLVAGGVLAVWSADSQPAFVKRLQGCDFTVRAQAVRSRGRKGWRHTVFVARAPEIPAKPARRRPLQGRSTAAPPKPRVRRRV